MIKASKCHSCPQRHSKPLKCHLGRIGFVKLNSLFSEQKRDHVLKEGFFSRRMEWWKLHCCAPMVSRESVKKTLSIESMFTINRLRCLHLPSDFLLSYQWNQFWRQKLFTTSSRSLTEALLRKKGPNNAYQLLSPGKRERSSFRSFFWQSGIGYRGGLKVLTFSNIISEIFRNLQNI